MQLTYRKQRGYHHWVCLVCRKQAKERIPDQADDRYANNPGNPWLGICQNCNGGTPSAKIQLGNSTIPANKDGFDRENGDNPLSYARLEGDWGLYPGLVKFFASKVMPQDKDDFRHDLIMEMVIVKRRYDAKGKPFTEWGMMRLGRYELARYWSMEVRKPTILSLNEKVFADSDDELIDTLADDKAIDLEAWCDARLWLLGCPKRLIEIAHKRATGIALDHNKERPYLKYWRKKLQKRLL